MKKLTLAAMVLFCSCHEQPAATQSAPPPPVTDTARAIAPVSEDPAFDTTFSDYDVPYTDTLQGDFNGDGQTELAFTFRTLRQRGNPMETGTSGAFEVRFSDSTIPAIKYGCCEARLVPEGDLNHDGADDFSIFEEPENGTTYEFYTYTFKSKKWQPVMDMFMVPTGGDFVPDSDLVNKVFLEKDTLYYLKTDFNEVSPTGFIKVKAQPTGQK